MHWIPVIAWGAAALLALVVFGFCAYEIRWKARRLRADLARLHERTEQLQRLRERLAEAHDRVAGAGLR